MTYRLRALAITAGSAILALWLHGCSSVPTDRPAVADHAPVFDGHNDFIGDYLNAVPALSPTALDIESMLPGQSDLPRWKLGGFAGSMVTVSSSRPPGEGPFFEDLSQAFDWFDALAASKPDILVAARSADDVATIMDNGKFAIVMHIEGGDQIDGSIENLRAAFARGVRMMTLVYDHNNDIGDGAMAFRQSVAIAANSHSGLSGFGRDVVAEMNDLGMMIDLSHASSETALETIALSRAPVVFSHSGARALADTPRNVPDDVLEALRDHNGLIMVSFAPYLTTTEYWKWYDRGEAEYARLTIDFPDGDSAIEDGMARWDSANPKPKVSVKDVADQIDYLAAIVGRSRVGIGSDYGGMGSFVIPDLADAAHAGLLFDELRVRGWSEVELTGLAQGNFLRLWRDVALAAKLK